MLYQHKKTGQILEFIAYHDREYAMVKDASGAISYPPLAHLEAYEPGIGRTGLVPEPQSAEVPVDEDQLPETVIPPETRMNLNVATAEMLHTIQGIGYATAKKIIELRQSLSGERFSSLDQLRQIGRVDWDVVFGEDKVFVG
jgi:DNA uptake protein ComE-like DNA-binding protein